MIPRPFNRRSNSKVIESKYSYRRQIVGPNNEEILLKAPHAFNMRKYLLARKFLNMNYIFRSKCWMSKRQCETLDEWNKMVKTLSQQPPSQKYAFRSRKHGRRKKPTSTVTHPTPSSTPVLTKDTAVTNSETVMSERVDLICDYQDLAYQVGGKDVFDAELGQKAMEETEEWQCRHWRRKIKKDYKCVDVMEIIASSRVAALTTNGTALRFFNVFKVANTPNLNAVLMEAIRYAIYTHQWKMALKGVEGLCEEITVWNKCWLMWNGGFIAIINLYKNDIHKVMEFATYTKDFMFCYPRRLGIEVACWLTQKGYFINGYQTLEEWHQIGGRSKLWDFKVDKSNPKRKMIDHIATLVKAVFQYSCWKRDTTLHNEGVYSGDDFSLKRSGETALLLFEELIPLSKLAQCDPTIFIEPLIELLIEFRSIFEAKEIFKDLTITNFGNGILEEMYLQFLETYFPFVEEEIDLYTNRKERFMFDRRPAKSKSTAAENEKVRFYITQKHKRRETVPLSLKEKPSFSW